MYFHAEISTESDAATKYADAVITNRTGGQIFYACDHYYGLFLPNETNSYGKELLRSVEKVPVFTRLRCVLNIRSIYREFSGHFYFLQRI